MEFTLAFGPKLEFSFSFKFFSITHGYILAHIALKINICFPLGKKFAQEDIRIRYLWSTDTKPF